MLISRPRADHAFGRWKRAAASPPCSSPPRRPRCIAWKPTDSWAAPRCPYSCKLLLCCWSPRWCCLAAARLGRSCPGWWAPRAQPPPRRIFRPPSAAAAPSPSLWWTPPLWTGISWPGGNEAFRLCWPGRERRRSCWRTTLFSSVPGGDGTFSFFTWHVA